MSGPSTIPPLSVPEGEARILDPKHPDYDHNLRDAVRGEAIIPPSFDGGDKEDSEIANNVALIQALGEMTESRRENARKCICSESATKSAFQSYPPPDKKGVFEDASENHSLGDDPCRAAAWDHLEEDGVSDPEDYREPKELTESEAADEDSIIPSPDKEDNSAEVAADAIEMEKIETILSVLEEVKSELKINAIYNAVGTLKDVEKIKIIVDNVFRAESDEEVLAICKAEGISTEEKNDDDLES